mmetsp:Transcript_7670/g.18992  ORF Transcript_7670/g.18992 Transcript_7670/m.18992 type:complete len:318 (-) Transcript_7670:44-997(-)
MAFAEVLYHGVRLIRTKAGEMVIGVPVRSFVGPDAGEHVAEHGRWRQVVVLSGEPRCFHVAEHGEMTIVNFFKELCVSVYSFFLEVADETMAITRADQVHWKVKRQESELPGNDRCPENGPRRPQLQRNKQMHALVFGLREQRVNPAVVPAHQPQGVQVANHASDHPGDACNCFKEDDAPCPIALTHASKSDILAPILDFVARADVEAVAQDLHRVIRCLFDHVCGRLVRLRNIQLFFGPSVCSKNVIGIQCVMHPEPGDSGLRTQQYRRRHLHTYTKAQRRCHRRDRTPTSHGRQRSLTHRRKGDAVEGGTRTWAQ